MKMDVDTVGGYCERFRCRTEGRLHCITLKHQWVHALDNQPALQGWVVSELRPLAIKCCPLYA